MDLWLQLVLESNFFIKAYKDEKEFVSCGDDDEEEGGGSSSGNPLVGTWFASGDGLEAGTTWKDTWIFYSNGTGKESFRYNISGGANYDEDFKYEIQYFDETLGTGSFYMVWLSDGQTMTKSFVINGNKLIMDGETFVKQ